MLLIPLVSVVNVLCLGGCSNSSDPHPNQTQSQPNPQTEKPQQSQQHILEELKHYAPVIETYYGDGTVTKGSGVCLGQDIVATNYHVVYPYGHGKINKAEVINFDRSRFDITGVNFNFAEKDIVFLKVRGNVCPGQVGFVDSARGISEGTEVIHFGHPGESFWARIDGKVKSRAAPLFGWDLNTRRKISWISGDTEVFSSDITAGPGSSGGGVFLKSSGKLVGIHLGGERTHGIEKNWSIHISSDYLKGFTTSPQAFHTFEDAYDARKVFSLRIGDKVKFYPVLNYEIDRAQTFSNNPSMWNSNLVDRIREHAVKTWHLSDIHPSDNYGSVAVFVLSDFDRDERIDCMYATQEKNLDLKSISFYSTHERIVFAACDMDGDGIIESKVEIRDPHPN
jgi:hypothetical protein